MCRYFLQPREGGGRVVKVEELGSLRLNIVYTEDHVFSSHRYNPLRDLLLLSASVQVSFCSHNLTLKEIATHQLGGSNSKPSL